MVDLLDFSGNFFDRLAFSFALPGRHHILYECMFRVRLYRLVGSIRPECSKRHPVSERWYSKSLRAEVYIHMSNFSSLTNNFLMNFLIIL